MHLTYLLFLNAFLSPLPPHSSQRLATDTNNQLYFQIGGWTVLILTLIVVLIIIAQKKQIATACAIIVEGAKAMEAMPSMVVRLPCNRERARRATNSITDFISSTLALSLLHRHPGACRVPHVCLRHNVHLLCREPDHRRPCSRPLGQRNARHD